MIGSTAGASAPYVVPQDYEELREGIRALVQARVAPRAAEIDERSEYPRDIRDLFGEHDIYALCVPSEYGGTGTGMLMLAIAIEEIAKACATSALLVCGHELSALPIKLFGTEEQKERILPLCASGEWSGAFALSEPEAGSDAGSLRTRATQDGDDWVISGAKNWITHTGVADYYVVFARTAPGLERARGITAFIVEADNPGLEIGALEHKLGIRGSPTGSPVFNSCRVGPDAVLGEVGEGFRVAMGTLARSRVTIAAQALGIAQGATDYAIAYAKEREQFGRAIVNFQGMQFKLADMETRTAAARELVYRAAAKVDAGERDLPKYSAMAKLFASDTAMAVTTEAVQVLGGYGYVKEYPVERMMRDAKITQIYEGTNEIQRVVIARTL